MIEYSVLKQLILGILLVHSCYTDVTFCKIFNSTIICGLILGLGLNTVEYGMTGSLIFIKGVLLFFTSFIPMYLLRGMAAGDVKLCAMVGGLTGPLIWPSVITYIYISGGLLAIVYVLNRKKLLQLLSNLGLMISIRLNQDDIKLSYDSNAAGIKSVGRMPYAMAITLGTLLGFVTNYPRL